MARPRRRRPLNGPVTAAPATPTPPPPAPTIPPADAALSPEESYTPGERPMTPKELADFLQISPATLRRQMRLGAIPFFHIGGQIRFLPRAVVGSLIRRKSKPS